MTFTLKYGLLIMCVTTLFVAGCKKKNENPPSVPKLNTAAVTNITATTARSGGTITSNEGAAITASGICWSYTNNLPTIADDTTKGTTTTGSFTADMDELRSGTTYYVRAYAINSVGTGYGQVISFSTGNTAPIAIGITITGNIEVSQKIVARYTYYDLENNPESGTSFQWYIANDTTGATVTPVSGATDSGYTIQATDRNKFLKVGITPKASTGTSPGQEFKSYWVGPVKPIDTNSVTFTYNGQTVTYGIITSAVTGRKWLDRNLGAPNTPTGYDDWRNMGDLFQWGRGADGHQLINRAATSNTTTAVHGTTSTVSISDNPGHSLFITAINPNYDWRSGHNEQLWKLPGRLNNVCPAGWHVPTKAEWEAEQLGFLAEAFNQLKLTAGGFRRRDNGLIESAEGNGQYWTATTTPLHTSVSFVIDITSILSDPYFYDDGLREFGLSVRCIKD